VTNQEEGISIIVCTGSLGVTIAVSQTADTELAIKAELQVALNERMILNRM